MGYFSSNTKFSYNAKYFFNLAYLKICHGYIFICDIDREESIDLMIKQIEKATNTANKKNCLIIANQKFNSPLQKLKPQPETPEFNLGSFNQTRSRNNNQNLTVSLSKSSFNQSFNGLNIIDTRNKNIEFLKVTSAKFDINLDFVNLNDLQLDVSEDGFISSSNILKKFLNKLL